MVFVNPTRVIVEQNNGLPAGLLGAVQPTRFVGGTLFGPPTTGSFQTGDFVIAANGGIIVCIAAGSPGTWQAGTAGFGVYVKDFGAVGDNATDNLAAILRAVDALGPQGGRVVFGAGIFRVSGTIPANQDNVHFIGIGIGATTVRTTSDTLPIFDFGDNLTLRTFLTVADMLIDSAVTRTGGAFIRARNTADLNITRCRLAGPYYGIDLLDTQLTRITDVHIINAVPAVGECIRANSTGSGSNLYLYRVATDAPVAAQPRAGLSVKRWDGLFLTDTQFNHVGTGFIAEPPAGQTLDHIFASNSLFDSNSGDGLYTPAGGGIVRRAWFLGCWFGSNDNNGVRLDGGALGFTFVQPKLFNNAAYGLILVSGTYLSITDVQASGNSRGAFGATDAILIGDNMAYVKILGGFCRPYAGFPNSQRRGVTIQPGCDKITVRDVDCDGNVNAVGISNLSVGGGIVLRNNRGYLNENKGVATQLAASVVVTVAHGLDVTPNLQDFRLTPTSDLGAAAKFFISNVTGTTFQINTTAAPGVGVGWSWGVQV